MAHGAASKGKNASANNDLGMRAITRNSMIQTTCAIRLAKESWVRKPE
jgi:hypothetical protein